MHTHNADTFDDTHNLTNIFVLHIFHRAVRATPLCASDAPPPPLNLGCEGVRESYYPQSDRRTAVAACADTQLLDACGGPTHTVVDSIRSL